MTIVTHPTGIPTSRRALRREATRGRLLEAAFSVFAAYGYTQATIDTIADAAGLSKGAVYFHFSSKEAVFCEVLWSRIRSEEERLQKAVARHVERPLEHLLEQLIAFLGLDPRDTTWPPLLTEFWSQAGRNERVREAIGAVTGYRRRALFAVLSAAVEAGVIRPGLRVDHCTDMLLTFGDGLLARAGSGQPRPAPEALAGLLACLLGVQTDPTEDAAPASPSGVAERDRCAADLHGGANGSSNTDR